MIILYINYYYSQKGVYSAERVIDTLYKTEKLSLVRSTR